MENPRTLRTSDPNPGGLPEEGRGGLLLESSVMKAFLEALGCHILILDGDLRLVDHDPGAPQALGLKMGPGGLDVLPVLARTHFASTGFRLSGPPIPLGEGGNHLWIFRDVRGLERREELEMVFLHEFLTTLVLREGGGGAPRIQMLWDMALNLYRGLVAPNLAQEPRREAPGGRVQEMADGSGDLPAPCGVPGDQAPAVLVVDDSPMVRRLLQAILAREYRVVCAGGGAEALALALEHLPDLILLDAVMPGLDGFAVCKRLKADPRTREIPILFLTALRGEVDEVRALEAGAIDFIQKPVNAASVMARVRNHVDLKHSKDKLREMAVQDGLTGLANRRHFDQMLALEWQRSCREGKPISLLMGDVDSFKPFNDRYGHVEGDQCLKAVGRVFRAALRRPGDLAARYGGEEFVCLLPDTDEAGARAIAEGITAVMAELAMPHEQSEVAPWVTVSLGVATAHPVLNDWPGALVEEADRRMYEAKRKAKARRIQAGDPAKG